MDLADVVGHLGGVCTSRELREVAGWRAIRDALTAGAIVRHGRGVYSVPGLERDVAIAARFDATPAVLTAARMHGWKSLEEPTGRGCRSRVVAGSAPPSAARPT